MHAKDHVPARLGHCAEVRNHSYMMSCWAQVISQHRWTAWFHARAEEAQMLCVTCRPALMLCSGPGPSVPPPGQSSQLPCRFSISSLMIIAAGRAVPSEVWQEDCNVAAWSVIFFHQALPVRPQHCAHLCILKGLLEVALQASAGSTGLVPFSRASLPLDLLSQSAAATYYFRGLSCRTPGPWHTL